MTGTSAIELYYDPFDSVIDDNPYPVWKRMREEAPLYYNEKYNFYALSRYEDVARELPNWQTYRSGRGTPLTSCSPISKCRRAFCCSKTRPCMTCIAACYRVSSRLGACWPWRIWCVDSVSGSWIRWSAGVVSILSQTSAR